MFLDLKCYVALAGTYDKRSKYLYGVVVDKRGKKPYRHSATLSSLVSFKVSPSVVIS